MTTETNPACTGSTIVFKCEWDPTNNLHCGNVPATMSFFSNRLDGSLLDIHTVHDARVSNLLGKVQSIKSVSASRVDRNRADRQIGFSKLLCLYCEVHGLLSTRPQNRLIDRGSIHCIEQNRGQSGCHQSTLRTQAIQTKDIFV